MRRHYAWGVTAIVALTACSGGASSSVQWADYEPQLQARIDALAVTKSCPELQAQFDAADTNGAATMTRTGHNNAKLMKYINDKMTAAGC